MTGYRRILLAFLAAVAVLSHMTEAAPQDSDLLSVYRSKPNPEIHSNPFISEDEMSEDDLNELADEIADQITMENDGASARNALSFINRGFNKIFDQGVSLAAKTVAPIIVDFIMDKTQEDLCSCKGTTCSCCVQPPGFKNACLEVKIRPPSKSMRATVTYNGKKMSTVVISRKENEGACARPPSGVASFIEACITPIGTAELEGGFRGCFNINLEPLSFERSMCIDFKGTRNDGTASFVPVDELDGIEVTVEEASEEEEEDSN